MVWKKSLRMYFLFQTFTGHHGIGICRLVKSVSLNIRWKKPVSTMLAIQRHLVTFRRNPTKTQGRFLFATSQSWLKWEPSSSTVVSGLSSQLVSKRKFTSTDKVDKNGKVIMAQLLFLTAELGWARNRPKDIAYTVLTGLVKFHLLLWCVRLVSQGDDEILTSLVTATWCATPLKDIQPRTQWTRTDEALKEICERLRPGEPKTAGVRSSLVAQASFDPHR